MAEHDSVIPAGGSGTLTAKVKTVEGQNRKFSKSITVTTDAAGAQRLSLRFTVEAYSPIVALPSARINLTTIEGSAGRAKILLRRDDGEGLVVKNASTEHPDVVVRALPYSDGDDSMGDKDGNNGLWTDSLARRNTINPSPGDVWIELSNRPISQPGTTTGRLRITTNDPAVPELILPYTVRVRPMIEIRPAAIRMWLSPARGNEGRSGIVSLRHNEGKDFAITGINVSHPELFGAAANSEGSAPRQSVRIKLVEGIGEESLSDSVEGYVAVTTDDPSRSMIEIPVVVSWTRSGTRRPVATRPAPPVSASKAPTR